MDELDPDSQLMRRIADGDAGALRRLVTASMPRIHMFCARILADRAEAEDVSQETILRAFRHAGRWRSGRGRLDTWLHTIALNLCRDRLRRRREILSDALPETPDPSLDPEAALIDRERQQAVAKAIGELAERQRDALVLVHYQELNGSEAAAVMGITVEALESLLARARRKLREQLANVDRSDDETP